MSPPRYLILANRGSLLLSGPESGLCFFAAETTAPLGSGPNLGPHSWPEAGAGGRGGLDFDTVSGRWWSIIHLLFSFLLFVLDFFI